MSNQSNSPSPSPQSAGESSSRHVCGPMRSWKHFFEPSKFRIPTASMLSSSIQANLVYFQTNYLLILIIFFGYNFFYSPLLMLFLPLCVLAWVHVMYNRQGRLSVGGFSLSPQQTVIVLGTGTVLVLYFAGSLSVLVGTTSLVILIISLHCVLHAPSHVYTGDIMSIHPDVSPNQDANNTLITSIILSVSNKVLKENENSDIVEV